MTIERPAPDEYAPFYEPYLARVPEGDVREFLRAQRDALADFLRAVPDERAGHRYAPGKWSVREVVGHVTDAERVFSYRALRIARRDTTPLPGFDENEYARHGGSERRTLRSLVDEFLAVRDATLALFDGLDDDAWTLRGTASDAPVSVRALAYVIAGHAEHHRGILAERYL